MMPRWVRIWGGVATLVAMVWAVFGSIVTSNIDAVAKKFGWDTYLADHSDSLWANAVGVLTVISAVGANRWFFAVTGLALGAFATLQLGRAKWEKRPPAPAALAQPTPRRAPVPENHEPITYVPNGTKYADNAQPVFGATRQVAAEPFLSWWHVAVTLDGGNASPNGRIDHCTIELLGGGLPMKMRWQSGDLPQGVEETTLLEGRTKLVPVVIRCEAAKSIPEKYKPIADGVARFTGDAYLRDGNRNKFQFVDTKLTFKLRIRSGARAWESRELSLRCPAQNESNGSFILEVWHAGED